MALINRVHTLRGDGNMKFGIPPKRVMRCHTTRKMVREINPRMSLLFMVFLNCKAREKRKEFFLPRCVPAKDGGCNIWDDGPKQNKTPRRDSGCGARNQTSVKCEANKNPENKLRFRGLKSNQTRVSLSPSFIQTVTVGSGITPDHALNDFAKHPLG